MSALIVTVPGWTYFESRSAAVGPGDEEPGWRTVRFGLDGPHFKSAESGWQPTSLPSNVHRTERLLLVLYTEGDGEGEVYVDRISFDRPRAELLRSFPPTNVESRLRRLGAKLWGRLEVDVTFEASHGNPFDYRQVVVFADVTAPSGRTARVPGFPCESGVWRVRYVPLEQGRHTLELSVQNAVGRRTLAPEAFYVSDRAPPGPVRISPRDGRHFEFASGDAFYPLGMNVAWAADFRESMAYYKDSTAEAKSKLVGTDFVTLPEAVYLKTQDYARPDDGKVDTEGMRKMMETMIEFGILEERDRVDVNDLVRAGVSIGH